MASCNGCTLDRLKKEYGDKLIKYMGNYYVRGEQPTKGQGEPFALSDGTPIRFVAWFMSEEHDHSGDDYDFDPFIEGD